MCRTATICRNTVDPDGASPILQRARSSCDFMAAQSFNDLDAWSGNYYSADESEGLQRTQFAPHVEDTQNETKVNNLEGGCDDFPLIKDVTSEAVWQDVSENKASLKDEEERRMASYCVIDLDSSPPQVSNMKCDGLISNAGDKVAEAHHRDEEMTPPPPTPPKTIASNAATPHSPIPAPSVVSEWNPNLYFSSRRYRSRNVRIRRQSIRGPAIASQEARRQSFTISPRPTLTFRAPLEFIKSRCRLLYRSPSEPKRTTILTVMTEATTEIVSE